MTLLPLCHYLQSLDNGPELSANADKIYHREGQMHSPESINNSCSLFPKRRDQEGSGIDDKALRILECRSQGPSGTLWPQASCRNPAPLRCCVRAGGRGSETKFESQCIIPPPFQRSHSSDIGQERGNGYLLNSLCSKSPGAEALFCSLLLSLLTFREE